MKTSELMQIIKEEIQKVLLEEKELTAKQKKLAAMYPPKDKITRGDVIAAAKSKNKDKLDEEEMTGSEEKKKEKFVKGMKGSAKDSPLSSELSTLLSNLLTSSSFIGIGLSLPKKCITSLTPDNV